MLARPSPPARMTDHAASRAPAPRCGSRDVALVVAALEHGRAGDQHVGAGAHHVGGVLGRDAAVDLDVDRPRRRPARARRAILSSAAGMKAWPPKPGLTDMTRIRSTRSMTCSMRRHRRAGIERDAGLLAERADRLQRAVHMRAGFDMHGDDVGAGLGEGFEIGIAGRDHQMHVERLLGDAGGSPAPRPGRWRCWARNGRPSRRHGSSRRRRPRSRALPRRAWRNRRTRIDGAMMSGRMHGLRTAFA